MENWTEYTRFFTALLVILDPFMAIPILLALTEDYSQIERNRVARIITLTVAGVLVFVALAGPGSMSTVIIAMHRSSTPYHAWIILAIIILVAFVSWLVLRLARPISKMLGEIGLNILNRIFGLVLVAIAVEVIANGLKQLFPVLA